jgi:hypothetical protein
MPTASYGSPPPHPSHYGSPPPMPTSTPASQQYTPTPSYYSAPPAYDSYGLSELTDPFAPRPPTHNDIASDILKAYSSPPPAHKPTDGAEESAITSPNHQNGTVNLSMSALTIHDEEEKLNPLEAAMKKLVNIDHIDEPAEQQIKLTLKKEEEKKNLKGKSKALPPAAQKMVGSGATLAQISEIKAKVAPKEDVMRNNPLFHSDAAMAGALVVRDPTGGPPPLLSREPGQVGRGFGVGAGFGAGYSGATPMYASSAPPPQYYAGAPPVYTAPPPSHPGYPQQQYR